MITKGTVHPKMKILSLFSHFAAFTKPTDRNEALKKQWEKKYVKSLPGVIRAS